MKKVRFLSTSAKGTVRNISDSDYDYYRRFGAVKLIKNLGKRKYKEKTK